MSALIRLRDLAHVEQLAMELGHSRVYVGYRPRFDELTEWQRGWERHREVAPNQTVYRAWWRRTDGRERAVVTVQQRRSASDVQVGARTALIAHAGTEVAARALGSKPDAPAAAMTHPVSAYANVLIVLDSYGADATDFEPWLASIEADLTHPMTNATPGIDMAVDAGSGAVTYRPRWATGTHAWRRFEVNAGTLELGDAPGTLLPRPDDGRDDLRVRGWVVEPGRPTYTGAVRIP